MPTVKLAAKGHLCQSRCLSAAPHTSLFYPLHFKCLVEAGLFLSRWLCDAKELKNAPKTQDSRAQSMWDSVLQVMQPKAKRIPKVTHAHFSIPFLEILPFILLGKEPLGPSAPVGCKQAARSPCWRGSELIHSCGPYCAPCGPYCAPHHPRSELCSPYTWYCAWPHQRCPISVSDLRFSEPGRSVAMLSVSPYWAVQGRIWEPDTTYSFGKTLTIICLSGSWLHLAESLGIALPDYLGG